MLAEVELKTMSEALAHVHTKIVLNALAETVTDSFAEPVAVALSDTVHA